MLAGVPAWKLAKLGAAIDRGDARIAVTFLVPLGAGRVSITGDWDGDRLLFEAVPDSVTG